MSWQQMNLLSEMVLLVKNVKVLDLYKKKLQIQYAVIVHQ